MNLRDARLRSGWDEWQLAGILDVAVSHIRGLEAGTQYPSRLVLRKIRAVLPGVEMQVRAPISERGKPQRKGACRGGAGQRVTGG